MLENLDAFVIAFQTSYEENWQIFVVDKMKEISASDQDEFHATVSQVELQMIEGLKKELQYVFNIIVRLNIRKEIKNELRYLTQKVM